ncbi:hypothetical protein FACS1894216_22330 [Synergistales bacterium]|nr:hypothetical protein FACS1894216_22330 [Synergistales bacterium]
MVDTRYYPEHCSLSEALDILLGAFSDKKLKTEKLPPRDALGMILAGEVSSKRNVPHYTASAVDGYTMTSASTAGASAATPVELAGASWVNTGMPVGGGDAVIMVEDTSGDSVSLKIYKSLTQGENVRALGEDVMNGQLLACRGDVVTPALVSLFLCAGVEAVTVYPRPRAIFIPTGNEIVTAEKWLSGDKIDAGFVVDSNSVYAAAMFESWGYSLEVGPVLPDDPEVIADAVSRAAEEYDLVLVSAGSAKGRRDHSADVFTKLGRMLFRYVRMKPGRPVMAADIGGTPVICSPGFPMSCAVALWSLVYPLLRILSGDKLRRERDYISEAIASTGKMEAELMTGHSSAAGVFDWLRVKCAGVGGRRLCWPLSAGASVLWALAEADGIVTLPEQSLESPPGTKVTVRITRRFDIELFEVFHVNTPCYN